MSQATVSDLAPEVSIRKATSIDVVEVFRWFREWSVSCAPELPEVTEDAGIPWVLNTIQNGVVWIATLNGPKHPRVFGGMLGLQRTPVPWNPAVSILANTIWYVPKGHIQHGVPARLIEQGQAYAAVKETPLVLHLHAGSRAGRTAEYYRLSGVKQVACTVTFGLSMSEED